MTHAYGSSRRVTVGLLLTVALASAANAMAATFTVDRADDVASATACTAALADCSLRGAIDTANGTPGSDTVQLSSATYLLGTAVSLTITSDLVLQGVSRDASIIDGDGAVLVLNVLGDVHVTVRDLTVQNGLGTNFGAGIYVDSQSASLLVERCRVRDNVNTYFGSGIYSFGESEIVDSLISGNHTTNDGGGLRNGWASNTMIVRDSLVSGNSAGQHGGGIANAGTLVVQNSTITDNTAVLFGGGILTTFNPSELTHVTLTGNSASTGDSIYSFETNVGMVNTLIVGECNGSMGASYTSFGGNLEGPGDSCGMVHVSDQTDVAGPRLGVLADNGGPTESIAIVLGSPAIDAALSGACTGADQRGIGRPQGALCDIGAYERTEASFPFTDAVLTAGASAINRVHFAELRERIDSLRHALALSAFGWTDTPLVVGMAVTAIHVTELRSALNDVYLADGLAAPVYTDPTLVGGTPIRAVHIAELREFVIARE